MSGPLRIRHLRSWRKVVVAGILAASVVYTGASAYVVSRSLRARAICPTGVPPAEPDALTFVNAADGATLTGWLVPSSGDRAVVLLHGLDSDAWAATQPDLAAAYAEAGFHVLTFDLRGHGRSGGGRLSLGALERGDIRSAVDLLLNRGFAPGRIALYGTSYGAAMGLLAAAEIPEVGAVVADSAFADVRDLIASEVARRTPVPSVFAGAIMRPGIEGVARLFYGLDLAALAPERVIAAIAPRPLLLIHGDGDRIVPVGHATRLKDHAAGAELWILEGQGHASGVRDGRCNLTVSPGRAAFLERVVSFVDEAIGGDEETLGP